MKQISSKNLDGTFKFCLGAECPKPCCKKCETGDEAWLLVQEREEIFSAVEEINAGKPLADQVKVDRGLMTIGNCFQGHCVMEDNRPSVCKMFPIDDMPKYHTGPFRFYRPGDTVVLQLRGGEICPQEHLVVEDTEFIASVVRWVRDELKCEIELAPELQSDELDKLLEE